MFIQYEINYFILYFLVNSLSLSFLLHNYTQIFTILYQRLVLLQQINTINEMHILIILELTFSFCNNKVSLNYSQKHYFSPQTFVSVQVPYSNKLST